MANGLEKKIQNAPPKPGVYIFYRKKTPLYVGKAVNLKNRLKSYLRVDDLKTQSLQREANRLEYKILRSEIEALIVESRLIKSLKPRYNILFRDDKSYFYVAFTKEKFPKIFITHKNLKIENLKLKIDLVGPFTDGTALKTTLRLLRKIFPYCTCKTKHHRPCLNAQIGNCLGFCCQIRNTKNYENTKRYNRNIRAIKEFLLGDVKKLPRSRFSEEQLKAIDNILAHREFLETAKRVECYDISHLAGKETVGVMTVFMDGQPAVSEWRKFKIRTAPQSDDPRAMAEVLERRLNHPEWPYPDLIIIDGGITQFSAVRKVISNFQFPISKKIKLISFAKPREQIYGLQPDKNPTPLAEAPKELQEIIKKAIRYTHRWAIKYHRQTRAKSFLPEMI